MGFKQGLSKKENMGKNILLIVLFIAAFCIFASKATAAGLWYDEAVEYFYSKYISGAVPGDFGKQNMYERICFTYQPPLYNVLMHIWLCFFDTEFGFRLAGVILTLIGAYGMYLALMEVSNYKWALGGTFSYIFTRQIAYYALECAEYNLLGCCMCWLLYFYVRCIKRQDKKSLVWFFVIACLAVYSQYGAIFAVLGLFPVLFIFYYYKRRNMIKFIGKMTISVGIFAALPLVIFFFIPQVQHRLSGDVASRVLEFNKNVLYDFVMGLINIIRWGLLPSKASIEARRFSIIIVLVFIIMTIISLKYKDKILNCLLYTNIITWVLCYILTKYQYYGFGGFGDRYGLFLLPMWILTLIYGGYVFFANSTFLRKNVMLKRIYSVIIVVFAGLYICFGVADCIRNWEKDNIRELVDVWYENDGYETTTFVHQWSDTGFQFYLRHHGGYNEEYQNRIIAAEEDIRNAEYEEMEQILKELEIFDKNELFYIGPLTKFTESTETIKEIMYKEGYSITVLGEEKQTVLWYMKKEG